MLDIVEFAVLLLNCFCVGVYSNKSRIAHNTKKPTSIRIPIINSILGL